MIKVITFPYRYKMVLDFKDDGFQLPCQAELVAVIFVSLA
jgi:hypothetical protein